MRELPIYKMIIENNDLDDTEVNFVSLVDEPAIERNWLAFSKKKAMFVADADRQILTGVLMVADLPIYRRDANLGEYYVTFDKENIYNAMLKIARKGYMRNVNVMHQEGSKLDGAYMFEIFQVDEQRGILPPKGFDDLTDGSLVGSVKVDDKSFWDKYVKTGMVQGFSIEGLFGHELEMTEDEKVINAIIKEING